MADPLPPQERLQPALLDRLTDDEPDKKVEPREARVHRVEDMCSREPGEALAN